MCLGGQDIPDRKPDGKKVFRPASVKKRGNAFHRRRVCSKTACMYTRRLCDRIRSSPREGLFRYFSGYGIRRKKVVPATLRKSTSNMFRVFRPGRSGKSDPFLLLLPLDLFICLSGGQNLTGRSLIPRIRQVLSMVRAIAPSRDHLPPPPTSRDAAMAMTSR